MTEHKVVIMGFIVMRSSILATSSISSAGYGHIFVKLVAVRFPQNSTFLSKLGSHFFQNIQL